MAAKKDFAGMNTGRGGNVFSAIETATTSKGQQGTASPEEAEARREAMRTQGRKGARAVRINMAFSPANHQFIKVMSRISGQSMTEFANYIVEQYRKEHPEIYDQAKAIIDQL